MNWEVNKINSICAVIFVIDFLKLQACNFCYAHSFFVLMFLGSASTCLRDVVINFEECKEMKQLGKFA